jgi:hypothetical protein
LPRDLVGVGAQGFDRGLRRGLELNRNRQALGAQSLDGAGSNRSDPIRDLLIASVEFGHQRFARGLNSLVDPPARGVDAPRDLLISSVKVDNQRFARGLDARVDLGDASEQGVGAVVGRDREAIGDLGADPDKPAADLLPLRGDVLRGRGTRVLHSRRHLLGGGA